MFTRSRKLLFWLPRYRSRAPAPACINLNRASLIFASRAKPKRRCCGFAVASLQVVRLPTASKIGLRRPQPSKRRLLPGFRSEGESGNEDPFALLVTFVILIGETSRHRSSGRSVQELGAPNSVYDVLWTGLLQLRPIIRSVPLAGCILRHQSDDNLIKNTPSRTCTRSR